MLFASRKFAFVLLLAALALGASGCNSNAKKIVGKWKMTGVGDEKAKGAEGIVPYLEFNSDGTGTFGIDIADPKLKELFGDAKDMTAAQWATVKETREALPGATVTLRMHKVAWKCDLKIALEPTFGVLVTQRVGPFTLRREYSA